MLPDSNTIVNKLLVCEGVDDPEDYVEWLMAQASLDKLRTTTFGVAINVQVLDEQAQPPLNDEQTDQLDRDWAITESNAFQILRNMGLTVSDEGHNGDGERVASVAFWTSADDAVVRATAKIVLEIDSTEPARTSSGTLNKLHPQADTTVWRNVSDLGRRLFDVDITFFDLDRFREVAEAARILESATPCFDCHGSTAGEYYRLRDDLWNDLGATGELCIGCVEKRLGRPLTPADFDQIPLNQDRNIPKSPRLLNRLFGEAIDDQDDISPERYVGQIKPSGISDEQHAEMIKRGFAWSQRYANGGMEWHIKRGRHSIYLIRSGGVVRQRQELPDIWTLVEYGPSGNSKSTGPAAFNVIMTTFDADTAQFVARSNRRKKLPEDVEDEPSPEHYLNGLTDWMDTLISMGFQQNQEDFWKDYELPGWKYYVCANTDPKVLSVTVRRDCALYGTNKFIRHFELPENTQKKLLDYAHKIDTRITKGGAPEAIDADIDRLHTKYMGWVRAYRMGHVTEAVAVDTDADLVDPEVFVKEMYGIPILEAVDLPPEDDPEAFTQRFLDKDLGTTFEIIKSGTDGVHADDRFRHDWLVYSDDKELRPGFMPSRSFEGYLRSEGNGWRPFDRLNSTEAVPLPRLYQTQKEAAYALYVHNQAASARFKNKRPAQEAVDLPPEDEPNTSTTMDVLVPDNLLANLGYKRLRSDPGYPVGENNWAKQLRNGFLIIVWPTYEKFEFTVQVYQGAENNWACRGSLAGVPISKLKDKLTAWEQRLLAGKLTDKSIGIGDVVREALELPPEDEPTNAILNRTFDPTAILKPLGYYYEANCWTKDIRREPGRRDIMIQVTRRGHAGDDSANTLYDFTVYSNPDKRNTFVPFHNIFGKTALQVKDTAERLDAFFAAGGFGQLPEAVQTLTNSAANIIEMLLK